jgi:hypothetical protein
LFLIPKRVAVIDFSNSINLKFFDNCIISNYKVGVWR